MPSYAVTGGTTVMTWAAWLAGTDGSCPQCRRGRENLCPASVYTGWDRDGGYAEYLVAADAYVHPLPAGFSDADVGDGGAHLHHLTDRFQTGRIGKRLGLPDRPIAGPDLEIGMIDG